MRGSKKSGGSLPNPFGGRSPWYAQEEEEEEYEPEREEHAPRYVRRSTTRSPLQNSPSQSPLQPTSRKPTLTSPTTGKSPLASGMKMTNIPPEPRSRRQAANPTPKPNPTPSASKLSALSAPKPNASPAKAPPTAPAPEKQKRTRSVPNAPSPLTTSTSTPSSSSSSSTSSTSSTTSVPNKIIPALRAAGVKMFERSDARTVDQGTALEIVSKIAGKRVTIHDIENERKVTSAYSLFSPPTELVTLYELVLRMVESHQFYSRTV